MGDMYVFNLGDDEERDRRAAERKAEGERLTRRYAAHLMVSAGLDEPVAKRVVTALFATTYPDGSDCLCGCHPSLSSLHDDGLDCSCAWDDVRRAEERKGWDD